MFINKWYLVAGGDQSRGFSLKLQKINQNFLKSRI